MSNSRSFTRLVGESIRFYRQKSGFTQEKLAVRLKTSSEYISALENGLKNVKVETLYKIGKVLDVDPQLFLAAKRNADEA